MKDKFVSRGGDKLASAVQKIGIDFKDKTVLDVGSSTGGFTDYAIAHGAKKVIAVDSGTNQMHSSLRANPKIELHEKTDIRLFSTASKPDIVLIDVSFISLRGVLPTVAKLAGEKADIIALLKPQFEAEPHQLNRGIVKHDTIRRGVIKDFEAWAKNKFLIINKADSELKGTAGNLERFYLLKSLA